ncbi:winged helix-turn-helix domain-containing protein [Saccharopolyspora sp. 5N708]|uniref:winged helix-turn-helix domain-containing protein n=1 Tax=Saccharopolyspora sp. 5N708 TaxID=3457424 RepID=UPI003FD2C1FD
MTQPDGTPDHERPRILVVVDDSSVVEMVTSYLHRAGLTAVVATDGATGLELVRQWGPDLVVLDMALSGFDGSRFRWEMPEDSSVPLIMLTSPTVEEDGLTEPAVDADDQLVKPFSPRELVLRIQAVIRRGHLIAPAATELVVGDLVVNQASRVVSKGGRDLALTNREFELLMFMLHNPGRVFRRDELIRGVAAYGFGAATIAVHVRLLREKIEDDPSRPKMLITVWGVGYRFDPPE